MKFPAIAICFLLPSLSAAQTACPADPKVYRCLHPPYCDLDGRRELVQLLMSHNETLLAASPGPTATELDWYQAEVDSGDGNRYIDAIESNVGSRISVRSALEEPRRMLIYLNMLLTQRMYSPEGQTTARRHELLRWQQAGWVQLARGPEYTTQDDIQTCNTATQAALQIVLDDFRAYAGD